MPKERRQTLRGSFLRVTIPLIFLTVIGVFGVIELMSHRSAVNRLVQTLDSMIATQSAALATPLWNLDHEQIRLSLEAIVTNREVVLARIYGEDGDLMLEVGDLDPPGDPMVLRLEVVHDAGTGPKPIGKLEFVATQSLVWEQTRLRLFIAAGIALLAVSMQIAAALFALRRIIGQPLERLLLSINKAKAGAGRERVVWHSSDELGQVISAFNDMQVQQEAYEEELRKARDTLEGRVRERTKELLTATNEATSTRSQLTAAIETISEGFSLYDRDDRLVICNTRYQELLRPEVGGIIAPGTPFESILRDAVDEGLIADAEGRGDAWVAERLASHRNPGKSHVQHRKDDRWILVNERMTEDGGTVAVYADITELKMREQELAEKSSALEQLSNQLAKYLSPQVYESIFRGKQEVKVASSRKKLTVFFSDIADFTETADRLESEELTQLLNRYLTEMSQIALTHGATIDKYVGDAILIFFGDPETRGVREDALACVEMAIAMRAKMQELQNIWRDSGIEKPLRCRMGIHTDYCTVGNFGSEDRMDYTIIGGGVNTASRLESLATPGEILISYETFAQIRDRIACKEHGKIEVKGIAYPLATYLVIGSYEALGKERRRYRKEYPKALLDLDLEAMNAEDRAEAAGSLREALRLLEEAAPAQSTEVSERPRTSQAPGTQGKKGTPPTKL
jgi:class 3 adenylate cyclase/PAS domain-containing protein